jgi:hypothetical protein
VSPHVTKGNVLADILTPEELADALSETKEDLRKCVEMLTEVMRLELSHKPETIEEIVTEVGNLLESLSKAEKA